MTTQLWWFIARSTGIVAWVLLTASVLWGLTLSARTTKRPVWVESVHRWVGGLSVLFTGFHLLSLWLDSYVQFSVPDLLVPFWTSYKTFALALGIIGGYLLLAVELTSLGRKYLPRKVWRAVHLSAFAGFWMATVHGVLAGSDTRNTVMFWLYAAAGLAISALTVYRIVHSRKARTVLPPSSGAAPTAPVTRPRPRPTERSNPGLSRQPVAHPAPRTPVLSHRTHNDT